MAWYDVGALLEKVPLEDLVNRLGLQTERRGHQVTAVCPFHQDTRPSLSLYARADGMPAHFHCFACGAHGNAVDLVKQVNGDDFKAGVEWLARQYNVQPTRGKPGTALARGRRLSALEFALQQFDRNHDTVVFERWCVERGFDTDFLYSKGLRCITGPVLVAAVEAHKKEGERLELLDGLLELGLIRRLRAFGQAHQLQLRYSDQFRDYFVDGRIVIPVYDAGKAPQKVVGFAGRLLDAAAPSEVPKYRLTPGFKKAEHLFNAQAAFAGVTAQLKADMPSTLYLVEGFLDALRLESLGQHAVALMGTSLSKEQYALLSDFVETRPDNTQVLSLCVFLDNDEPGFNGADRLVRELLGVAGVDLQWMGIPWRTRPSMGKDPDACLRGASTQDFAQEWLTQYTMPAEALLLLASLGGKDSSALDEGWNSLPVAVRERALFRAALAINRARGKRQHGAFRERLGRVGPAQWAVDLGNVLKEDDATPSWVPKGVYLDGDYERTALARTLAYFGSRRGELPCDEEAWLTLGANARLFDTVALDRLKSVTANGEEWRQAAAFEAVNLPRKLSSDEKVLSDPRLKVMPHPADLHVQQIFLNELLTERHDRLSADGLTFSASIPAVRWYSSQDKVVVTGPYPALNEPDLRAGEPATLSFGYQIDMEVLEGHKTPSDQGMFRPFGQCWRAFMACLGQQCRAIGPQVHVLRLDVKRYYDSVQRFVVRDRLLAPLIKEINASGLPEGFARMLSLKGEQDGGGWAEALERLLTGFLFGYSYRDPGKQGDEAWGQAAVGIPQGPVISAYIGTVALFPVDNCARRFIRESSRVSESGQAIPRAGYARYVDDIVIFADSAQLLGQLREALQAEATLLSLALIQKGERVRPGSPEQVMRQLNEGRGLAASVPGWEAPLVGDGEVGWGLAQDIPSVDRQCALQMLRHPDLLSRPKTILPQVKAALAAKALRPNDIGLCARWLWWLVALESNSTVSRPSADVWAQYWRLWEEACQALVERWDLAFEPRGYHWLYAIEGLDRLLDPNPWAENGQTMSEVPRHRAHRLELAQRVCQADFFDFLKGTVAAEENLSHLRRRARLMVMKASRLVRQRVTGHKVEMHLATRMTSVEWLCLAAEALNAVPDSEIDQWQPLNPLKERGRMLSLGGSGGLGQSDAVCDMLINSTPDDAADKNETWSMTVDFVLNSAPQHKGLEVLATFKQLFDDGTREGLELIANLPVASKQTSLYALNRQQGPGSHVYVFTAPPQTTPSRDFIQVALVGGRSPTVQLKPLAFDAQQHSATCLGKEKSVEVPWKRIGPVELAVLGPPTQLAAALFEGLYAMHLRAVDSDSDDDGEKVAYVPFKPQLVQHERDGEVVIHLVGEPVERKYLGVNAWFHDDDGRVHTTGVPQRHADIWRVGWAVADVLGIAASMSGETGNREEVLAEDALQADPSMELGRLHADELERYVLRQQLRKLQGAYLSDAQADLPVAEVAALPGTVRRALELLRSYPSQEDLRTRTQHVLVMEAQTKAMALRLGSGSGIGTDLRNALHRVFPQAVECLPLWVLQGMGLASAGRAGMRPELGLMQALYEALSDAPGVRAEQASDKAPALRVALALAVATAGLRGSVAAVWGLTWGNTKRFSELPRLPETWALPETLRADPQTDYRSICKGLTDADADVLERATPWHWILAMAGLLDASFPQALEVPALAVVFSTLGAWRYADAALDQTGETTQTDVPHEEAAWPFEGLPTLSVAECDALVEAVTAAMVAVDDVLGMQVVGAKAPRFGRDPHTGEFSDASGKGWQMSTPQYSFLGRGEVERVWAGRGKVSAWTETRRTSDGDLLAVHWLNGKLGGWFGKHEGEAVRPVEAFTPVQAGGAGRLEPAPLAEEQGQRIPPGNEGAAAPVPEAPPLVSLREDAGGDTPLDEAVPVQETHAASRADVLDELRRLRDASFGMRRRAGADDSTNLAGSHFRVALLQLNAHDSYCHPLAEVGIGGLPLGEHIHEALVSQLGNKDFTTARKAAKPGSEHQWEDKVDVVSWPEHRRRAVLKEALHACDRLGVELLVLPEVSLRKETVHWMKEELVKHYPGLAVLAGTYRDFSPQDHSDHLKEMLCLLWRPEPELSKIFRLEDNAIFELSRGKKYRSVASHELFKPDMNILAPLYFDTRVMDAITQSHEEARLKGDWSSDQVKGLVGAFAGGSMKLRHCMELICSELFLLTSPANHRPLMQELERMLAIFDGQAAVDVKNVVRRDVEAVGELLSIAQPQRERRSVLLVPAHTNRTNDYWHAGQASVLASGTVTVFCNAVLGGASGNSCFIGIDSVSRSPLSTGTVKLLTPYHGWHTGILQPDCKGALSGKDQALVVVDIDPVHVVSGKPRPQLLPEPMSLVAYLPIVEVVDEEQNVKKLAEALVDADRLDQQTSDDPVAWLADRTAKVAEVEALLKKEPFSSKGASHERKKFGHAYQGLKECPYPKNGEGYDALGANFFKFFGDPKAVCERLNAWHRNRHQQPGAKVGSNKGSEPAWVDFLIADLTCGGELPRLEVPAWRSLELLS